MPDSIAKLIDHSLLHPTMTDAELEAGCEVAKRFEVPAVCIKPYAVPLAARLLADSGIEVCTVIGFPHGSHTTEMKVAESEVACRDGATELDMVVNVGKVLGGDWDFVERDIAAVVDAAHRNGAITKVIFENDFLSDDETKIRLCQISGKVGAEFVKTSTGFGFVKRHEGGYHYLGATEHDVRLMREHSGPNVQVKAAGGIRTYEQAALMRDAGATRIGASATAAIVEGERAAG